MLNCGLEWYRGDSAFPPAVIAVQEPLALVKHRYLSSEGATATGAVENAERVKFWVDDGSDCSETTAV